MPKWLKVLLLVMGGCMVFAGLLIGGAAWWVSSNADQLKERTHRLKAEGEAFGKDRGWQACEPEALRRADGCTIGNIMCEVAQGFFFEACLTAGTPDARLCDGVPRKDEILASVTWSLSRCAAADHPDDQRCTRLMGAIQRHCGKG